MATSAMSGVALLALLLLACSTHAFLPSPPALSLRAIPSSSSAVVRPGRLSLRTSQLRMVAVATGGDGNEDSTKGQEEEEEEERVWPAKASRTKDYDLQPGEIAVRFINSPGRSPSDGSNDVIAAAKEGDVLMAVGDSVGVVLPRGCQTGLCGACTCDLEDPSFPGSRSQLRACSTKVTLPAGCDEMVVDVYRMLNKKGAAKIDPMARFNSLDDPNVGFKARWNLPEEGADAKNDCSLCGATGVNAKGMMPEDCTLEPGCPFSKF